MITSNNIKIEVGDIPKDKDENTIYFKTFADMQKVLTPQRIELLNIIKTYKPKSIYNLAEIAKRDQGNVTKDVNILKKYGFIEINKKKEEGNRMKSEPKFESDTIEMIIKIGAGIYGVTKEKIETVKTEFQGQELKKNTDKIKNIISKLTKDV